MIGVVHENLSGGEKQSLGPDAVIKTVSSWAKKGDVSSGIALFCWGTWAIFPAKSPMTQRWDAR